MQTHSNLVLAILKTVKLAKKAGSMSGAVFLSRIFGLVREQVFAFLFGAGLVTDAFIVAFRIPNLFRDLLAEGALSNAFVSVFAKEEDEFDKKELFFNTFCALNLFILALCVVVMLLAPWLVNLLASNFKEQSVEKFHLTVQLTGYLTPFLYFTSMAALSAGVLNTMGLFFLPALGPACFNLCSILVGGGLAYMRKDDPTDAIWGFATGALIGGFAQWAIMWRELHKRGYLLMKAFHRLYSHFTSVFKDEDIQKIMHLMLPAVVGMAATHVNILVNTIFATSLQQGSVTWLNYAYRLIHFPLGVFGVALSTAALPSLALYFKREEMWSFHNIYNEGVKLSFIFIVGSMAGMYVFAEPLAALLFQYGKFSASDSLMTAQCVWGYALGLLAFVNIKIVVACYYAIGKVWIPTAVSFMSIAINYFGASYLSARYQHVGLAFSVSITALFQWLVLVLLLRQQKIKSVSLDLLRVFLMCVLLAAPMLLIRVLGVDGWLLELKQSSSFVWYSIVLLIVIGITGVGYIALCSRFVPEFRALKDKIVAKFRKPKPEPDI